MAGPYSANIIFSNRRRLSIYLAANVAVGTYLPCEINGAAVAGSPTSFRVPEDGMMAVDMITTETAGEFQIIADGVPTNRFIQVDASQAATAIRPPINLKFRRGVNYQLQMTVAGAA